MFNALVHCVVSSSAVVWGTSVKYNPQRVGKDHELNDEDVVQVVKRWEAHSVLVNSL